MHLHRSQVPSLSSSIVKALVDNNDIEVISKREVALDVEAVLNSYLNQSQEVTQQARDLVQEGDTKFEVIEKCGEPLTLEFVGYRLDNFGNRDLVIEHLIYGPKAGWYYLIEIVGGKVNKIESFKD